MGKTRVGQYYSSKYQLEVVGNQPPEPAPGWQNRPRTKLQTVTADGRYMINYKYHGALKQGAEVYSVVGKHVTFCSLAQRIGRIALGILLTIVSLGFCHIDSRLTKQLFYDKIDTRKYFIRKFDENEISKIHQLLDWNIDLRKTNYNIIASRKDPQEIRNAINGISDFYEGKLEIIQSMMKEILDPDLSLDRDIAQQEADTISSAVKTLLVLGRKLGDKRMNLKSIIRSSIYIKATHLISGGIYPSKLEAYCAKMGLKYDPHISLERNDEYKSQIAFRKKLFLPLFTQLVIMGNIDKENYYHLDGYSGKTIDQIHSLKKKMKLLIAGSNEKGNILHSLPIELIDVIAKQSIDLVDL